MEEVDVQERNEAVKLGSPMHGKWQNSSGTIGVSQHAMVIQNLSGLDGGVVGWCYGWPVHHGGING